MPRYTLAVFLLGLTSGATACVLEPGTEDGSADLGSQTFRVAGRLTGRSTTITLGDCPSDTCFVKANVCLTLLGAPAGWADDQRAQFRLDPDQRPPGSELNWPLFDLGRGQTAPTCQEVVSQVRRPPGPVSFRLSRDDRSPNSGLADVAYEVRGEVQPGCCLEPVVSPTVTCQSDESDDATWFGRFFDAEFTVDLHRPRSAEEWGWDDRGIVTNGTYPVTLPSQVSFRLRYQRPAWYDAEQTVQIRLDEGERTVRFSSNWKPWNEHTDLTTFGSGLVVDGGAYRFVRLTMLDKPGNGNFYLRETGWDSALVLADTTTGEEIEFHASCDMTGAGGNVGFTF